MLAAALLLGGARDGATDTAPQPAAPAPSPSPSRWTPTLSLRAAQPTAFGLSLAVTIGADEPSPCPGHSATGPSASVEGGTGGGMIGVGYGAVCAPTPPFGLGGLAVRAAYARTWGHPWSTAPDQNYVGIYGDVSVLLTLRVGVLKHVGRSAPGAKDWVFLLGGGIGF